MGLQEARDWIEDLEIREKLNENPMIMIGGLTLVIVFCFALVVCHFTGGGSGNATKTVDLVYFDTQANAIRLVEHTYPGQPASPLEGGETVYMATVYACEQKEEGAVKDGMTLDDLEAEGMFVGYLERLDPDADADAVLYGQGKEYRTLTGTRWYSELSPQGEKVLSSPSSRCSGRVWVCKP